MCISMATDLRDVSDFDPPAFDSVEIDSLPPPPPLTLDDQFNSPELLLDSIPDDSSNSEYLSPCRHENSDDQSESALFVDAADEAEEKDDSHSSPVSTVPISSSYRSFSPSRESWVDRKSSALDWPTGDSRPLTGDVTDTDPSDELVEARPLASFSPPWFNERKSSMVGAGLANLGNTCFLNSIIQCFIHTVPLVQGLRSFNHPMPCDRDYEGFCVLCALRGLIDYSMASSDRVVSPWKLVDNLSYISSDFRRFQQEDAHEFLQCLLDRLENCCLNSKMKETSVNENLVKQVFGGRLISKLQCCNCGHCSDTYEPTIDLSLEIEDVSTLASALESFTKVEKIEDPEMKFTCEKCNEKVSVEKQLRLDQAPSIAMFHLKRFKNDGSYVEKIDKHVEFSLELDLSPYTCSSQNDNEELKYDLYAVVVHIGLSSNSGHYYCFVRSAPDRWYRMDDSKVVRVREEFVLSQEAYILIYAKQGTPWFSSFMKTEMSTCHQNIRNNSPKSVLDNMDHISMSPSNLRNVQNCEVDKAGDNGVGTSMNSIYGCGNEGIDDDDAKDDTRKLSNPVQGASNGCGESSGKVEVERTTEADEAKESTCKLSTPEPRETRDAKFGTPSSVERRFSPSALTDRTGEHKFGAFKNSSNIMPSTPPRSPSPDIYADEDDDPLAIFSLPKVGSKSEKHVPVKRQLEKELAEDSHRKQARKLCKGMPSSRATLLMAAMNNSPTEGSRSRKKNKRPEATPRKGNLNPFMRSVVAGSFR